MPDKKVTSDLATLAEVLVTPSNATSISSRLRRNDAGLIVHGKNCTINCCPVVLIELTFSTVRLPSVIVNVCCWFAELVGQVTPEVVLLRSVVLNNTDGGPETRSGIFSPLSVNGFITELAQADVLKPGKDAGNRLAKALGRVKAATRFGVATRWPATWRLDVEFEFDGFFIFF